MTVGESLDMIEASNANKLEDRQFDAVLAYNKMRVSSFSSTFPDIYEVFPTLFDKDEILEARAKADQERLKNMLRAWGDRGIQK